MPLTPCGVRFPVQLAPLRVITVEPAAPGPVQLSTTPLIADSSATETVIGPDRVGHCTDELVPTIVTVGACSTEARAVSCVLPSALLTTAKLRTMSPSGRPVRSMPS